MIKTFLGILIALPLLGAPAAAATLNFDIKIDAITGEGEAGNIGFFSTGAVGDVGTGKAIIEKGFPADYTETIERTNFFAAFPGVGSAVTFFDKTVVHDPILGTVTVSGSLGGLTGNYLGFTISPEMYEFVYTGVTGGPVISSGGELETFLSTATMSGFVSAFFLPDATDEGYKQTIEFSAVTPVSEVPLPAGALLLLTSFGVLATRRRKT